MKCLDVNKIKIKCSLNKAYWKGFHAELPLLKHLLALTYNFSVTPNLRQFLRTGTHFILKLSSKSCTWFEHLCWKGCELDVCCLAQKHENNQTNTSRNTHKDLPHLDMCSVIPDWHPNSTHLCINSNFSGVSLDGAEIFQGRLCISKSHNSKTNTFEHLQLDVVWWEVYLQKTMGTNFSFIFRDYNL